MMFTVIKPDKVADFEMVMARVKDALARAAIRSASSRRSSWRVFKGLEAGPGGTIVYVWFLDPPVKDADYTVTSILTEAFPNEAQDLWSKYVACFVSGQTMLNLQQIVEHVPDGGDSEVAELQLPAPA